MGDLGKFESDSNKLRQVNLFPNDELGKAILCATYMYIELSHSIYIKFLKAKTYRSNIRYESKK